MPLADACVNTGWWRLTRLVAGERGRGWHDRTCHPFGLYVSSAGGWPPLPGQTWQGLAGRPRRAAARGEVAGAQRALAGDGDPSTVNGLSRTWLMPIAPDGSRRRNYLARYTDTCKGSAAVYGSLPARPSVRAGPVAARASMAGPTGRTSHGRRRMPASVISTVAAQAAAGLSTADVEHDPIDLDRAPRPRLAAGRRRARCLDDDMAAGREDGGAASKGAPGLAGGGLKACCTRSARPRRACAAGHGREIHVCHVAHRDADGAAAVLRTQPLDHRR